MSLTLHRHLGMPTSLRIRRRPRVPGTVIADGLVMRDVARRMHRRLDIALRLTDKSVTVAPLRDMLQYTLAYTGGLERRCEVRDRRRMQHNDRTL